MTLGFGDRYFSENNTIQQVDPARQKTVQIFSELSVLFFGKFS